MTNKRQSTRLVTTEQADEQMPMPARLRTKGGTTEVLPEAHGRSSKQREPPENLQRRTIENGRGQASGLGPTALRPL